MSDELSQTLTLMFLAMRGGTATDKELWNDYCEWHQKHGDPTKEKINEFIKENRLEIDIGLAATNHERHNQN
jgi:hypothetical protein